MKPILLLISLCLSLALPDMGWAHRVDVFVWIEEETIHTQSRYGGGKPVQEGTLLVYDARKELLLQGAIDAKGEFSFPIPQRSDLLIAVETGTGHRGERKIAAGDLDAGYPTIPLGQQSDFDSTKDIPETEVDMSQAFAFSMEKRLDALLDRKLKPVHAALAKLQNRGTNVADILGGIGYILGLVGLAAYWKSRQERR